jgi:alkanesulfonate monooxygenase SsuD/methylene tetrahydromethanopterin reductase-like flavin-dependent oxidoreductase (luciferase family)
MTIALGYGLVTCQVHPDRPETWHDLYQEAMTLAEDVERNGLDSIWVSEHHFVDDGHLPSLLPLLAAFAARTSRVTLGAGLLLAPLHDPLRVIEDAAVVDLLASGRLALAFGLGWRQEEFDAFGVTTRDRVRRTTDLLQLARTAWAGEPVEAGAARPRITPLPAQPGGPPVWFGGLVEPAVRRAGRIADGFMATEVTPAELAGQVDWVREERVAHGRDDRFTISVHLPTLCLPAGVAWSDAAEALRYPGWKYDDMGMDEGAAGPLRRPEPASADELDRLRATSVVGTPAEVAEQIRAYDAAAGGDLHFIARSYLPSLGPDGRQEALQGLATVRQLLT